MIWQGCYLPLQRSSIYTHTQTQTATAGFHSFKLSHTGALCHCNADKHSVSHAGWTFTSQASVPQQCQIQLTEINKIAFSPAFALPGTNILVHSFFLSLSFTSSSPDQPRSASLLICFSSTQPLHLSFSPASGPQLAPLPAERRLLIRPTLQLEGIFPLFHRYSRWHYCAFPGSRYSPCCLLGKTATERIWFPLLSISLFLFRNSKFEALASFFPQFKKKKCERERCIQHIRH